MGEMAIVKSVSGNSATVELGNGELKTAAKPLNVSVSVGYKVLIMQVSGKYLIINAY